MKILLDLQGCQSTEHRDRGIGRYSMSFARALVAEGAEHEFHILLNAAFPESLARIRETFAGVLPDGRVHEFHVPPESSDNGVQLPWRARAALAVRRCAIGQVAPDFMHVSSLFEGRHDDCAVDVEERIPTSVTVYDFIPHSYPDRYLASQAQRAWYGRKLDALGRASLLLGISQATCDEAARVLPAFRGRVVNASAAADPSVFHPARPGGAAERLGLDRPFVLYTGGLDPRKNVEGLIAAFGALPRALRNRLQLAIVCHADDGSRKTLLEHAKRAGLPARDVVITGFVADDDLAGLYRSCELFVFPSLHEGFGLPALEAMMCGAPVIGSDTSSIPEVIGREDALFDPRSQAEITDALRRALEDDAFRASLKAHAAAQAARFSWQRSARLALDAMEASHRERQGPSVNAARRLRLAMHAPLPPIESGISDYTCELLPALEQHYEIELVHAQEEVALPPALAHLPVRDVAWFRENANSYDRVVYQFGNSRYHAHMFGLLHEVPGAVVLHDFFLSGVLNWMEHGGGVTGAFRHALARSHGNAALEFDANEGRPAAIARYPGNRFVVERATGVIAHSRWSMQSAEEWYGEGSSRAWRLIPHLRVLPKDVDRDAARRELGLAPDDFLVCSFGHIGATKLNDRLLQAWHASSLASDPRCKLVLVGKNDEPPYGDRVDELVARSPRISITGFAPRETYERHLAAADVAVQLRTMSRGETSGAVLDCLGWGVPLIANANGSNAEYPADVVCLLPDAFSDEALIVALEKLRADAAERARLSRAGRDHVATFHDPAVIAAQYRDAIEEFAAHPQHRGYWDAVAEIGLSGPASERDLAEAAIALEATWVRG